MLLPNQSDAIERLLVDLEELADVLRVVIGDAEGQRVQAGPEPAPVEALSRSEARVLRLLTTNLSAPEISSHLCVSVNTIRTHMRHLYEKLGVHTRSEAVDQARALGLLTGTAAA
jgi:LuxR family transcriptional regulator, maltose regulon positive regulatory protein